MGIYSVNPNFYQNFYIWPAFKQILLLDIPLNGIVKVIKPLHDIPDISKHWFAIYYLHYKDKQVSNPSWSSIFAANYLYFRYNLGNLSTTSLIVCDSKTCTTESSLVTKKTKLPRTVFDLFNFFQSLFLFFSLTIFKCTLIFR